MQSSNSTGTTAASQQLQQLQQLFASKTISSSTSQMAPPPPQFRPPMVGGGVAGGGHSSCSNAPFFPTPPPHPQNMSSSHISSGRAGSYTPSDHQVPVTNNQGIRPPPMQPSFTAAGGGGAPNFSSPNQQASLNMIQQSTSNDFYKLAQLFASSNTVQQQQQQAGTGVGAVASHSSPQKACTIPAQALPEVQLPSHQQPRHTPASSFHSSNAATSNSQWSGGSGSRMAVFIEQPTSPFELVESDLRRIFSNFSNITEVRILTDRVAAEVAFTNPQAVNDCRGELDGLFLTGVGTLRLINLMPNQTAEQVMPLPRNFADMQQTAGAAGGQQNSNQRNIMDNFYQMNLMKQSSMERGKEYISARQKETSTSRREDKITTSDRSGISGKQVYRLELIDLFGYDPEFDVTKAILGVNNSNINYIMEQAKHKVDISIKGKALNNAPIAERLHMTISSDDPQICQRAVNMCEDLLKSVCEQFVEFCLEKRYVIPNTVGFRRHEYDEEPDGNLIYKGAKEKQQTWLEGVRVSSAPFSSHYFRRSRTPPHSRQGGGGRGKYRDIPMRGINSGRGGRGGRNVDNWGDKDGGRRNAGGSGGMRNADGYSSNKGRARNGGRERGGRDSYDETDDY